MENIWKAHLLLAFLATLGLTACGGGSSSNTGAGVSKQLFVANDGVNGSALWITDGTKAGTKLVKDIHPATDVSIEIDMDGFISLDKKQFFAANDGVHGSELWVTDGTEAGTTLVKDIRPSGDSNPWFFTELGDQVYFSAYADTYGRELWVTDGTEEGTKLVKDINPSANASSNPRDFTVLGDKLYFVAREGSSYELWLSDGAEEDTVKAKMPVDESIENVDMLKVVDGKLLLIVESAEFGREPWITDGTKAGTKRIQDINPGAADSVSS